MIATPLPQLKTRARSLALVLGEVAQVTDGHSMVGGGSLPEETLPTKLVSIRLSGKNGVPGARRVKKLAERLRRQDPPVIARIEKDSLILDLRTVLPSEDERLLALLKRALAM